MTEVLSTLPPASAALTGLSRSIGLKCLVVFALAMAMCIPAFFVDHLVDERSGRAEAVVKEVSARVGGAQTFLGPVLAVPFQLPSPVAGDVPVSGVYFIAPVSAKANVKTQTEELRRSLFRVPIFRATLGMEADFDLAGVTDAAPAGAALQWNRAELVVGVSDVRGALADGTLTSDGKTVALVPAESVNTVDTAAQNGQKLFLFGARLRELARPEAQKFHVSSSLRFSGAQRLALLANGKSSQLKIEGDWPNPGFDGGFSPVRRSVAKEGFSAEWSIPFMARAVRATGQADTIAALAANGVGVSFVEVANPYQSVTRVLKYLPLFLSLVFLSYFVFEVTTGKPVHPAQYVLVGAAQTIFYLLLLSMAERIGFDLAFLLAGAATVGLLSANAGWVFASRRQGVRALAIFSLLYGMIYVLLRLEDNALLVGATASFAVVAAAMYFTRTLNWYGFAASQRPASVEGHGA